QRVSIKPKKPQTLPPLDCEPLPPRSLLHFTVTPVSGFEQQCALGLINALPAISIDSSSVVNTNPAGGVLGTSTLIHPWLKKAAAASSSSALPPPQPRSMKQTATIVREVCTMMCTIRYASSVVNPIFW